MNMKKLLIATLLALNTLCGGVAYAGTCEAALGGNFTPNQRVALCEAFGSAVTVSLVPQTTDTIDLGDATHVFRRAYIGSVLDLSHEVVAGAGTTVADAAALSGTKIVHQITGANGTVGWKFPTTTLVGQVHILQNTTAGVAKIYAAAGGTVNGGAADAAFSALTGIKPIICISTAADTWICS